MFIKFMILFVCVLHGMIDLRSQANELVKIQVFYECHCPFSMDFFAGQLNKTVDDLNGHLEIHTYPYGNAKTTVNENGTYSFTCQHGPEECYGNKLHACAIDYLKDIKKSVIFNTCMMDDSRPDFGSTDDAADECADIMDVDSDPIKECAKGAKGSDLLHYYGEESKKENFQHVPYVLINQKRWNNSDYDFRGDVCKAFEKPPQQCN